MKSKDGVFVSPSSIRGIDLPDDKARWTLFIKCPFPDLNDPFTSARCYAGKWGRLWYLSQCTQNIVQGSGRAVRHEKDWARVYIYDEKAKEILIKYPLLFPLWFREAVEFELRETMTWL
jgi:Rad3-related DNA helicase